MKRMSGWEQGLLVRWLEARVQADGELAEAIADFFSRLGTGGAVLEQLMSGGENGNGGPTYWVKAYLPVRSPAHEEEQRRRVEEGLWHLSQIRPVPAVEFRLLADEDWTEAWKKHYHPVQIGHRLVVKPSWIEWQSRGDQIIIELDPGLAFGTGLHPSTQLVLALMEDVVTAGQKVLDLGTGSGILAIAAAKLGADAVLAVDIDPIAVDVAMRNAEYNGVAGCVQVAQGTLPPIEEPDLIVADAARRVAAAGFDLILVNILAPIIAEMLTAGLSEWLAPGGQIIAAGIILDKEELVRQAMLAAGLRIDARKVQGDWVALRARKPGWSAVS